MYSLEVSITLPAAIAVSSKVWQHVHECENKLQYGYLKPWTLGYVLPISSLRESLANMRRRAHADLGLSGEFKQRAMLTHEGPWHERLQYGWQGHRLTSASLSTEMYVWEIYMRIHPRRAFVRQGNTIRHSIPVATCKMQTPCCHGSCVTSKNAQSTLRAEAHQHTDMPVPLQSAERPALPWPYVLPER